MILRNVEAINKLGTRFSDLRMRKILNAMIKLGEGVHDIMGLYHLLAAVIYHWIKYSCLTLYLSMRPRGVNRRLTTRGVFCILIHFEADLYLFRSVARAHC
jgi:hypothetical protein